LSVSRFFYPSGDEMKSYSWRLCQETGKIIKFIENHGGQWFKEMDGGMITGFPNFLQWMLFK
jgi:hypothetical protein